MKPEETGPCLVSSLGSSGPSLSALICTLHSRGPALRPLPSLSAHGSALPSHAWPGRALQESLRMSTEPRGPGSLHQVPPSPAPPSFEEQLRLALELSSREQEERERRGQQEEEDLQRILQLSLTEH